MDRILPENTAASAGCFARKYIEITKHYAYDGLKSMRTVCIYSPLLYCTPVMAKLLFFCNRLLAIFLKELLCYG